MTMKSPSEMSGGKNGKADGEEDDSQTATTGEAATNEAATGGGNKFRGSDALVGLMAVLSAAIVL